MEVIPSSNLQNQQQNQNSNLGNQNVAGETVAQPETQASTLWKIFDFVRTSIFELFLIALFSILILTTFNYFNLIPLSSVFPALSILPQQQNLQTAIINTTSQSDNVYFSNNFQNLSSCNNPNNDKNITLNQIIKCSNPQKFTNTKNNVTYSFIPNTDQASIGDKGVQINFAIKVDTNGKDDLGLMFGGDSTANKVYISYYPNQNAWGTQFLFGSKITDFIPIYSPANALTSQRAFFSLRVSTDGKTLALILPNGDIKIFNEGESFYTKAGTLPITALLPSNSSITIYSLNYYTPQ